MWTCIFSCNLLDKFGESNKTPVYQLSNSRPSKDPIQVNLRPKVIAEAGLLEFLEHARYTGGKYGVGITV